MPEDSHATPNESSNGSPPPYQDKIALADDSSVRETEAPRYDEGGIPEKNRKRLSESHILILGFSLIILLGTALLKLPWASSYGGSISWGEALFTATSATTVTGLSVLTTATDFSLFGQIVILLLLQIGGVGFIAFSVLLYRLIGRRITLQNRFVVQKSLGSSELSGALNLALYVLVITLTLETIGAFLLWIRWKQTLPAGQALWYAVFHSISSYCNAGFDLYSGTDHSALFGYGHDWYSLMVMGVLIVLGGFGITILYDLWSYRIDHTVDLNTRFTLWFALGLTVIGSAFLLIDSQYHALYADAAIHERVATGIFSIVSARTAGITLFPLDQLTEASQMIIMIWMFIGGAPASMAGGVSTSAFAILIFAVVATTLGRDSTVAFKRTLPAETIAKAVAIMTVSVLVVVLVTLILVLDREGPIFTAGFEVVSAFSNTGYSLGLTSSLGELDRLLIAFTMLWGRLGPLTVVVALAQRERPMLIHYPEEPVILG